MKKPSLLIVLMTGLRLLLSIPAAGQTNAIVSTAEQASDPEVMNYNLRIGAQAFHALYQFSTNDVVVEEAEQLLRMGSDILKCSLEAGANREEPKTLAACVRANPSYTRLFDLPFHYYFLWTTVAAHDSMHYWQKGPQPEQDRREYEEIHELTRYLLTRYNGTGKTFLLGHWEGDWLLLGTAQQGTNNPAPEAVRGMRSWLNARQQAVDDAKRETPHRNVDVFVYAEVNRVRDAMQGKPGADTRLVNAVLPFVTNLDYVSYSSYDAQDLPEPELDRTLDYIVAHLPTNKAAAIPGRRLFIGEYGFGGNQRTPDQQVGPTRAYLGRVLRWGVPYALFWQVYNNEAGNHFCLIDSQGKATPCYDLFRGFLGAARSGVAGFKQSHGRLPTDAEFTTLALPLIEPPAQSGAPKPTAATTP